jgi:hypothetical protein
VVLQQFEGVVTEVGPDSVSAEIYDLTDTARPVEVIELPISEVPLGDRAYFKPGGAFYWSVGRETTAGGQIRRVSEIRLRRSHMWSQRAVNALQAKGEQLLNRFSNHGSESTPEP